MRFMLKDIMVDIILSVKFPTHEHIELATLAIDMWPITPPPITGTVTQVFPVKIVPEHLPLLFSGCKYGTKR